MCCRAVAVLLHDRVRGTVDVEIEDRHNLRHPDSDTRYCQSRIQYDVRLSPVTRMTAERVWI
jgi:hypothetical protein